MTNSQIDARALVFDAPGRAVMVQSPLAAPGPHAVLIEAEVSLVSAGTERSLLLHAPAYPVLPGYSMVGTIIATGDQVRDFAIGDRVVATAQHASHVVVDESFVARVPDGLSSEHAAYFNIGAMAIHCLQLAQVRLGDPVLVLGQGLIGLIATQIAHQAGAVPVIGVDIDHDRIALARTMGADLAFHAVDDDASLREALRSLPGGGPAATIELSGGSRPIDFAIEVTRRQGRIVPGSLVPGGHPVDIYGRVFLEGLTLVGSYFNARPFRLRATETTSPLDWPVRPYDGGSYNGGAIATSAGDVALFLRLAALGRLQLDAMCDEHVAADDAAAMCNRLPQSKSLGCLIHWR